MKSKFTTILLLSVGLSFSNAQSVRDEDVEYEYVQLPQVDLRNVTKNYSTKLNPLFEENNKKLMYEYEQEKRKAQQEYDDIANNMPKLQQEANAQYEREMAQYAIDVKAAEDRYAKEMEEYKKKSLGDKLIERQLLGENTKPYKQLPPQPYRRTISQPYLRNVPMPKLATSYDYAALANTYVALYGFQSSESNAIRINVTMNGFEHTEPTIATKQMNETVYANGKSSTYPVTYYSTEFTYRHPMSFQVIGVDGRELMNVTPSEFNNYVQFKSPSSKSYPGGSNDVYVKNAEEKVLQDNLSKIGNIINDMYGFKPLKRKGTLYFVKNKNGEYNDLMDAYNDASMGLKLLVKDETMAAEKLGKALTSWKTALSQADLANKDARIDKDVAIAVAFDILEVCLATADVTDAFPTLENMNKMDLSRREQKRKEEFEMAFIEMKKRKKN